MSDTHGSVPTLWSVPTLTPAFLDGYLDALCVRQEVREEVAREAEWLCADEGVIAAFEQGDFGSSLEDALAFALGFGHAGSWLSSPSRDLCFRVAVVLPEGS